MNQRLFCNSFCKKLQVLSVFFAKFALNKQKIVMNMCNLLLFMGLGTGELVVIALVVLLLFGGKKIPELMKGLGKGVKSFKEGMNEVKDEIEKPAESDKK